jgi:hypothetical protein
VVSTDTTLRISAICECVDYVPSVPVRPRAGVVLDTSGRPLPHSRLEIVAPDRREVAYTDATGRFEVRLPNTRRGRSSSPTPDFHAGKSKPPALT